MDAAIDAGPLARWHVLVLRPAPSRAPLLRRLRAAGATVLALPAMRLQEAADRSAADAALARALRAQRIVFTSPAAVVHARRLPAWRAPDPRRVIAVGSGTAAALARAGIAPVAVPAARSDSEGVLALPALAELDGVEVGLVTAPGGRGLLATALRARGATLHRADVYRRVPARLDARHRRALEALGRPAALLLSSLEALDHLAAALPAQTAAVLAEAVVVAASDRLAAAARARGARETVRAASARPDALVAALVAYAKQDAIR